MELQRYYIQHKTFLSALECFSKDTTKYKRFYSDKRLSVTEKKILKSKYYLKKNKFENALELLAQTTTQNDFIEGHKLLLLGLILNNSGKTKESLSILKRSYRLFKELGDINFSFHALSSLAIALANRKNTKQMLKSINLMKNLNSNDNYNKTTLLRCESLYYSLIDEKEHALSKISQAIQLVDTSSKLKSQMAFFLIAKFVIVFKFERYEECEAILDEYKKTKGYTLSANYNFIKTLLNHFLHDKPIYTYNKHLKYAPELKYQVNTIKHLSCGEFKEAKRDWEKLQVINSKLYANNFVFLGDYCLFSACLNKHALSIEEKSIVINIQDYQGTIQEKLLHILQNTSRTYTKEELILLIWDEEYTEENSKRFNKLLSRTKKKHDLDIRVRKGSYKLIQGKKAS